MVDLLHPIWPGEIYRVATSLLNLENPLKSPSALCVLQLLLENAGFVVLRLTDVALRLSVLLYALLEAIRLLWMTFTAPERHLRKQQGWHPSTIEGDTVRHMLHTLLLLEIAQRRLKVEPRRDEEVDRFFQLLSRYQGLTERTSGPEYEALVKQFKIGALREIGRECEALHKEATNLAGPEAVAILQAGYSGAASQSEGEQSLGQSIEGLDTEDEVERDLWHDYPEVSSGCEFAGEEEAEDDLQDIWPDELVTGNGVEEALVEGEGDDDEGENYDPEEEVDAYDYENDPERYFAGTRQGGT